MVSLPFPPCNSWALESWLGEKQHHIRDAETEHVWPPGEPCPSPAKYSNLAGSITESSKDHSAVPSSRLLQERELGKTSEVHPRGHADTFLLL